MDANDNLISFANTIKIILGYIKREIMSFQNITVEYKVVILFSRYRSWSKSQMSRNDAIAGTSTRHPGARDYVVVYFYITPINFDLLPFKNN